MVDRILRYLIKTEFRGFDFYFIPCPVDGLTPLQIIACSDADLAYVGTRDPLYIIVSGWYYITDEALSNR